MGILQRPSTPMTSDAGSQERLETVKLQRLTWWKTGWQRALKVYCEEGPRHAHVEARDALAMTRCRNAALRALRRAACAPTKREALLALVREYDRAVRTKPYEHRSACY